MMRRASIAALTLAVVAGSALAANSYLGQEAPEFTTDEWVNRPERITVAAHRGEVLLLEFFATW